MITPPVGLNVFVLKSVVGDQIPTGTIFCGVAHFLIADLVIVFLLIAFPDLVLYLPSLLGLTPHVLRTSGRGYAVYLRGQGPR